MEDDFQFQPPDETGGYGGFAQTADAAWMLELIKIKLDKTSLPKEIKESLVLDMVPYINNASMMKITPGQVKEFLGGYKELYLRYRIFKVNKKHVPELNYVMAYLREILSPY